MIEPERWQQVNRELVAKAIGECTYEELIAPERIDKTTYRLELASGTCYTFQAQQTPWTWLRVDPATVTREGEPAEQAAAFFHDAQAELGIGDLALGEFLAEIHNTLYSELRRRARLEQTSARELVQMDGTRLETFLDGHPKILANKGRVGWGEKALARYGPEAANRFQLRYVAIAREACQVSLAEDTSPRGLLAEGLDEAAREQLADRMTARGVSLDEHVIAPVHPWQFQRYIRPQYTSLLARGELVDLGCLGDLYLPQQSIRTLSNVSRPGRHDVKLALTILNTSCYRGIPGTHLQAGVQLSGWLARLAEEDPVLAERGLAVLQEAAAVHCPHRGQASLEEGPYRFQEMLGTVWRESLPSLLAPDEQGILLSALGQTDAEGRALVAAHVERSGLSAEAWLRRLFETVTVPLYHLMARYGIGLVAHGQNVNLVLADHRPQRGVVKDVHGDLRLVDEALPEHEHLPDEARQAVQRLPPDHILQDLITGHLVSTLRFVSPLVADQLGLPETRFYAILAETLGSYMDEHPELADRFATFDPFQDPLDKVLVNKVRFRAGFGHEAQRPVPRLGTPIANPLAGGAGRG